jgi:hypothetical protein
MKRGNVVILPDPRLLWEKCMNVKDTEYSMLSLLREARSRYGLSWIGFETGKHTSKYKIIDEVKYNYFYIKYSDLIENF